jgi:3-hydroxyacyl-CoA dehydrogenase/3-hydroxy-2-methylbutyryl-CoA dehydrogenase
MQIEGNVFVVTGAGSGLGAASARMLAQRGGIVVGFDLSAGQGDGFDIWPVDCAEEAQIVAAMDKVVAEKGPLKGVVHCAGIVKTHKLIDPDTGTPYPTELFRRTLDVNLTGTFLILREAALRMRHNEPTADGERGVVVNTASIAGLDGSSSIGYAASKGGVISMLLTGARDLGPFGIRVTAIAPGYMETAMFSGLAPEYRERLQAQNVFPKRLAEPAEFAALACEMITNVFINATVYRLDAGTRN